MTKITITIDLGKYKEVTLPADDALKLLDAVAEVLGKRPSDIDETIRYVKNFDVFYEMMKKKFKDAIAPPHSVDDMIRGDVVIDKVALLKEGNNKLVTITFDRRVPVDVVKKALEKLGYEVEIKKL